jgi:HTH-type transcriptional regulator/antitoxin HigA
MAPAPSSIELKILDTDEDRDRLMRWLKTADREADGSTQSQLALAEKLLLDYECLRMARVCRDAVDAIRYRMLELDMRQKDLAPLLGGRNRASEILARRRPLTLTMIRTLTKHLGIPADLLILEPRNDAVDQPMTKAPAIGA